MHEFYEINFMIINIILIYLLILILKKILTSTIVLKKGEIKTINNVNVCLNDLCIEIKTHTGNYMMCSLIDYGYTYQFFGKIKLMQYNGNVILKKGIRTFILKLI